MLVGIPQPVLAAEQASASITPWQWLIGSRGRVSRNVTDLGRSLDDWLAGEGVAEQANETYLSVRLNQIAGSFDGYNSKVKVGGRLDLPRVSERWKLIFESDVEELNSLEDKVLDDTTNGESVGALRYEHSEFGSWRLSHDIGLRARVPADPFYRFRARFSRQLSASWSLGLSQKIWHYDSRGWGYETEVGFNRILDDDTFLRIATEANYRQDRQETEIGQSVALHKTLGALETLSYEVGVLGVNKPNVRISNYYAQVTYRKPAYEDWLIMEVAPQVLVARDENWRPQPRLIFNLEMLFFDF